jgi:hypothetical protein
VTAARLKKDLAVLVRREDDGKVFSEIRDRTGDPRLYRGGDPVKTFAVTIDRQRGRGLDMETICNRAKYLAELLDLPYDENLTQVCLARRGLFCTCPDCVAKTKAARK